MAKQKELPREVPPELPPAPAGDQGRTPKFETPTVADVGGPVPRVIKPIERAPRGLTRYKVRCTNFAPPVRPGRYILAASEDEARRHYLHVLGLDAEYERAVKQKPKDAPAIVEPELHVVALTD